MPRHLLFLTAARTVRHRPAYAAMELISLPWNHEVPGYDAWLYPAEPNPCPRAVRVGIARQGISHVSTNQGSMWLCDGEPLRRDRRDSVTWAAAALRHSVVLTPPVEALRLPAFVASDPRLRPCRYEAVVRLHARTLADLPDFEVSANELADLTRIGAAGNEKVRKAARDAWRTEPRAAAEMAPLPAAMHLPVHVEHGAARTHGVLRLDSEQSPGTFRSTLFLSHDDVPLAAGAVLARRAERHWADRSFRSESQVATVQRVGWPLPFAGGGNDPPFGPGANADAGGAALPIVCTECCQRFGPDAFTLLQLEVIEYWGEYAPLVKEHSLLTRTQRMYTRHPDARGQVRTKLDTILHSDDPEIRKKLFDGVPFNEIDPPRPAEYEGRLRAWADGDEELVQFLETHSFNLDRRLEFVRQEMSKWEARLADRIVVCPDCGGGAVALAVPAALA